ncbi:MAG: B12-binding domain-containing radical SAM protein [Lachnospiraceae bacterium]|nr:B12-binding domain-containing radical SAM protein [Lachnospiraceae bacterium]
MRKLKVCLIRPPSISSITGVGQDASLPLGLAYLAGAINIAGYDLQVIDAVGQAITQYQCIDNGQRILLHGLTFDQITHQVDPECDIIAISCMFSNSWVMDLQLIEKLHGCYPDKFIVIGGEHATALPLYILENCPSINAIVLGEGEETIVELIRAYGEGLEFFHIDGIAFRYPKTNEIIMNKRRKPIVNIDLIPKPSWDFFNIEAYISHAFTHGVNLGRSMAMLMTRGCPHQCAFCSCPNMWTNKWRARKPEFIIEEMKEYIEKYKIDNFDFYDLSAIINRDWITRFCNLLIKEDLGVTWQLPSGTRSEIIDYDLACLIYKSGGIRAVGYAPESGSSKEQIRLQKNVSIKSILESMKASCKAGLEIKANLIFGFPGQTWKDIMATSVFVMKMALIGVIEIAPFPYSPYPGSKIFNELIQSRDVEINHEYFLNLLHINDPIQAVSFSDRFSSRTVKLIIIFMLLDFYFFSFLIRPHRFFKLIYDIFSGDSSSRITYSVANVKRRYVIVKMLNKSKTKIIEVPQLYYPSPKKRN